MVHDREYIKYRISTELYNCGWRVMVHVMAGTAATEMLTASVGRPVDSATVSVAGRSVAYAEYGAPAGRPVAVLHGTPGSSRLAGLFAPAAAEQGVRLLAVDRPGYGDSEPWPDRSLADIGSVVTSVLDDAGVDAAGLVGFSGGGPHALAVAATTATV